MVFVDPGGPRRRRRQGRAARRRGHARPAGQPVPALRLRQPQQARDRRGVDIDLARPARNSSERLAGDADVLLEDYRPGVLERAGLRLCGAQRGSTPG